MRTLIAISCGDNCPTDFLRSLLGLEIVGEVQFTFAQGSLVYDARNKLCGIAVKEGFDRVLWFDSDMVFKPDLMKQDPGEQWPTPYRTPIAEIPDEPFEIAGCGFGAVMMTVDLLRTVKEQFGLPFSPAAGFGEDLSFCLRVTETGAKILCDPSITLGHVGQYTYSITDIQ